MYLQHEWLFLDKWSVGKKINVTMPMSCYFTNSCSNLGGIYIYLVMALFSWMWEIRNTLHVEGGRLPNLKQSECKVDHCWTSFLKLGSETVEQTRSHQTQTIDTACCYERYHPQWRLAMTIPTIVGLLTNLSNVNLFLGLEIVDFEMHWATYMLKCLSASLLLCIIHPVLALRFHHIA